MSAIKIRVIGAGVGNTDVNHLIKEHLDWADIFVGGKRFISELKCPETKEKVIIKGDVRAVLEKIRSAVKLNKNVVVISDGDPLFFGIARGIVQEFGKENVEVYPNITVAQVACARLGVPFEEMGVVSLHGKRSFHQVLSAMMDYNIIGIYTDSASGPKRIADELVKRDIKEFSMTVLEELGTDDEKITEFFDVNDVINNDFSAINFVVLKRNSPPGQKIRVGMEDEFYIHEGGLITKREVRAVSISMLELDLDSTVWDIGAGCGSVGIECAAVSRRGRIFCIERDKERVLMIKQNVQRAGAYIVEAVHGSAPECLKDLPVADRAFIGGGLSEGLSILEYLTENIK
ncbi:bifunctional cobalt-precorrin-7 (C(5))-methyltransferase/cobalt-precorrin-6B (C(15))-methyltransferase, partial [Candidatus Woesearchaeota archaeon]